MSVKRIELEAPSGCAAEHRARLAEGRLVFQRCVSCTHAWLPPRDRCPRCLSDRWRWEDASGFASVVSWVVYHRAYHEAFADRVPYNVTLVELDEGPRMISTVENVAGADGLRIDARLEASPRWEGAIPVMRFRLIS